MRIEEDFLGKVEVPADAYYGSFTARAHHMFKLSGYPVPKELTYALIRIKKCAALTNSELKTLDQRLATAIVQAADQALTGKYDKEFVLDIFQAGAGTPLHMNVNEVLANVADESLGGKRGTYKFVHPNNHVNLAQSSNDVTPTAIRLATLGLATPLIKQGKLLQEALQRKAKRYEKIIKIGRTHLQDAVPMTYGQTFVAWARALEKDIANLDRSLEEVRELGIGGTAIGSGITTHPGFREKIMVHLNNETNLDVRGAKDLFETTESMNDLLALSAALRQYAVTMNRIANDLRLLASGPKAGIAEILLPDVEPGSSIMPGKINPSVPEAVNMVCFRVIANDQAVLLGAQGGQLELNFYTPLIGHSLIESEKLLAAASELFLGCIDGTRVDETNTAKNFERSFGYATAFNPYIGYKEVSLLVRESLARGVTLKHLIVEKGILSKDDVEKVIASAIGSALVDEEIKKRVRR